MRRKIIGILTVVFLAVLVTAFAHEEALAQKFNRVKVTLNNGMTLEGKDGVLTSDALTLMADRTANTQELSNIRLIMAKKGTAGKLALLSSCGCGAIALGAFAAAGGELSNGEEINTGQYMFGTAVWMAVFAGAGWLIGNAADDWQIVYTAPAQNSMLKSIKLYAVPNQDNSELSIGLCCRF